MTPAAMFWRCLKWCFGDRRVYYRRVENRSDEQFTDQEGPEGGPVFGCWMWGGGRMSQLGTTMCLGPGYVDFAGSTVVHAVGGFCAMALSIILGPRLGKFGPDGKPRAFPAHNIVLVG
jgi:hypothetical protein